MNACRVRLATETDARSVCALHRAAWEEVFSASYLEPAEAERRWSDVIKNKTVTVFLCEFDDKHVGFIAFHLSMTSLEIRDLYVFPSHRRHGIGRALVNDVLCRSGKRCPATLWVAETSKPAISLYRKMGFNNTGETTTELRRIDGGRMLKMYRKPQ